MEGEHTAGSTTPQPVPDGGLAPAPRHLGDVPARLPWLSALGGAAAVAACLLAAGRPPGRVSSTSPELVGDLLRLGGYAGITLLVGAWIFWWRVPGREHRQRDRLSRLATVGLYLLAVTGSAGLVAGLIAGEALDRPASAHLVRMVVSLVALVMLARLLRGEASLAGLGLCCLALAVTVVTARTEPLGALTVGLRTVHLLAAAAWLGALIALSVAYLPLTDSRRLHKAVVRFPLVSLTAIGLLAATGTVHALTAAGSVGALVHSSYGALLLGKVLLVCGMLIAGLGGHAYVRSRAGRVRPVQLLGLFVGVELAFGIAVLVVTLRLVRAAAGL